MELINYIQFLAVIIIVMCLLPKKEKIHESNKYVPIPNYIQKSESNKVFSKQSTNYLKENLNTGKQMKIIPADRRPTVCGVENHNVEDKIFKLDYEMNNNNYNDNHIIDKDQKHIENIIYMNNIKHCDFL